MQIRLITLFFFIVLTLVTSASAQTSEQSGLVATANGVLVVWNEPGNYYTVEIRGKSVKPVPNHNLWFQVDGKFFQIVTPSKKEFIKDTNDKGLDARTILTSYRDWESDYISQTLNSKLKVDSAWIKLSDGTEALAWSFDMPHVAEKQTAKRQLYLCVVKRDHVFGLNTVVETDDEEKALHQLLVNTMNTLKPSDKPLSLEKARHDILKEN